MSILFDSPVVGVAAVVLISSVLFAPTIVAHFRRLQAFRSVSALNALILLLVVCFPVAGWIFWGLSPLHYWRGSPMLFWSKLAIWAAATIWSFVGKQRDS